MTQEERRTRVLVLEAYQRDPNAPRGVIGRMDENSLPHGKSLTIDTFDSEQKGDRRPLMIDRGNNGKLSYHYCVAEEVFNHGKNISRIIYLKDGRSVEFLDGTLNNPELVEATKFRSIAFSEEVISDIIKDRNSIQRKVIRSREIEEEFIRDLKNTVRDL